MVETPNLSLPSLEAGQAQKHITVNEALFRLDALSQIVLISRTKVEPKAGDSDGCLYFVPDNPTGDFSGQSDKIALKLNGGWVFLSPRAGWVAYVMDEAILVRFDGNSWVSIAGTQTPAGAGLTLASLEAEVPIIAGTTVVSNVVIPKYAMVIGLTGRITAAITGTLTGWSLGVAGATNRYASGLGLDNGSWLVGMGSAPMTYYAATPLVLTAEGGDFSGGTVCVALHYIELTPPRALE